MNSLKGFARRHIGSAALAVSSIFLLFAVYKALSGRYWPVSGPTEPRLVCDQPVHDFGHVPTGQVVEHSFMVRNAGRVDLEILQIRTECGCTVADVADKTIRPGRAAAIQARLSLKNRRGPQHQAVVVDSNDPNQPSVALTLQGLATCQVSVDPAALTFGEVDTVDEEGAAGTVEVRAPKDVRINRIATDSKYLSARLENAAEAAGYRVIVTLKGQIPPGDFHGRVFILTNHPDEREITIPVSGRVLRNMRIDG